jgi:transcription elongation GreA/GreB family factor
MRRNTVRNESAEMDEELREIIEIARIEAEFALLEIKLYGAANAKEAQRHMEALIVRLDEFLKRTHWSNETPPRDRRN